MRTLNLKIKIALAAAIFMHLIVLPLTAQTQAGPENSGAVNIVIEGTSNIHDWTMTSDKGKCNILFEPDAEMNISKMNFTILATTIKSESKAMDKNAYKALKTDKFQSISFTSTIVNIKPKGINSYNISAEGNLTISGVTKPVLLTAIATVNPDKSISYAGSYNLKMTDFDVEPPSIMMGAIKTGNDLTVRYNLVIKAVNYQNKN